MATRSLRSSRRDTSRNSVTAAEPHQDQTAPASQAPPQLPKGALPTAIAPITSSPALESESESNLPVNPQIPPPTNVKGKAKQKPWPQPARFKSQEPSLSPSVICVSTLLKDADLALMPSLDPVVLTRARRRASSSRDEKPGVRRSSSSHKQHLTNGINGVNVNIVKENRSGVGSSSNTTTPPSPEETVPAAKQTQQKLDRDREKALERNIDNVIFGDVTFKAWYPSWYPKEIIGEKGLNGESKGIVVSELYVCKRCFGYGKAVVEWVSHTRCCEKEVPGRQVYRHGKEGVWAVWEVDGGVDTLFCQNLSLFAKLFLDNKSVFFDVSGFNYFLLVHTSLATDEQQIVGFFSKEKMSWDNNNLACILIFPPWQRKSLGTLLMGISYSISRREQILGGPEKPISDLGKKGYKRFWGAEIARWLLECKESDRKKGRGMVTVGDVSRGTWIAAEDCLCVLREMGVVEKAGKGKGVVERVRVDKMKIREWVERERVGLERVVDEGGFVEGYAVKEVVVEEEMGD